MKNAPNLSRTATALLFTLRISIGWHFLYEGLAKVFNPNWTSAGYLVNSSWFLSGFFHWIAAHPLVLRAVDLVNMWGLVLIGLALFFGCFTRLAAAFGIVLLALYYMANPPFLGYEFGSLSEGSYLIVNKNLIELLMLALLMALPLDAVPSLDSIITHLRRKMRHRKADQLVPAEENSAGLSLSGLASRREVIKNLAAVPFFGVFVLGVLKKKSYEEQQLKSAAAIQVATGASMRAISFATLDDLKGRIPLGRIGEVEISRLVCGGNLISSFAHARDLIYVSTLLKRYFTDEKVIETLQLCEACGINTAILRTDDNVLRILQKYRKRGGKIQWLAQTYPRESDLTGNIQKAIDNGAIGAFVQGGIADRFVRDHKLDLLQKAISYIRSQGVIAGTAAHSLRVPMAVEEAGIELDFYMKTFHRDDYWSAHPRERRKEFSVDARVMPDHNEYHDNIWCLNPEETAAFMRNVDKPWIAYKVLAAGAIHPRDGFRYVFENGADFACVGMFDFQIVENVNIATEILNSDLHRERSWCA